MKAIALFPCSKIVGLKALLIVAALIGAQAFLLSAAQASKPNEEPFALIERQRITETIEPNGTVIEVTEMTTLINSQLAVDSESQADLPYNSTFANLEVLEAYTITPQGQKIPVAANAIRTVDEDNSKGAAMFSDQKSKIIIFPKVTPGSRTYYKTRLTTHTPLMPGFFATRISFSPQTVLHDFDYSLTYPEGMALYTDVRGPIKVTETLSNGKRTANYQYQNRVHENKESHQISYVDFAPAIIISTYPSYAAFAKDYEDRIKGKAAVTPEVQKLANEITKGIPNSKPKEQARSLYNWVTRNIRYVAIYLGDGGIIPHDADSIIRNRYGDCKDHNTLLIALLTAKGIEASSALINQGGAYSLPKYPVIGPFNHVITYLPQWDLYVDSTAEMAPFGVLPSEQIDKPTLLTALQKVGRTPKPKAELNQTITKTVLQVNPNGEIKGKSHTRYVGDAEIAARYKFEGADTKLSEKMVRSQLTKFRQTGEGTFSTSNVYDLDKPFTTHAEYLLDAMTNVPGPGAMTIPVGVSPGELASIVNNRPPESFKYPYRCSTRIVTEQYEIAFPENVKVSRIPQNTRYQSDEVSYESSYSLEGNKVIASRSLTIQRPNAVCMPDELQAWRKFYPVLAKDVRGQIFYE
jgi:transglutaminase-like putative cysteine protease